MCRRLIDMNIMLLSADGENTPSMQPRRLVIHIIITHDCCESKYLRRGALGSTDDLKQVQALLFEALAVFLALLVL